MRHLYLMDGSLNPEVKERHVIIWGCGNDGKKLFSLLTRQGIKIECFVDSDRNIWGNKIDNIPVKSYEILGQYQECNLILAFYRWPEVVHKIPEGMLENVYADFWFEEETSGKCILCGSEKVTYDKAHFAPFLIERMFLGEQKSTKIIHCPCCKLHFSEYRPNAEEMSRLYSGYRNKIYVEQRKKYEPNYTNKTISDTQRKEWLTEFCMPHLEWEKINHVLDYGGDKGQLIPEKFKYAEKYVYDISGNEVVSGVALLRDYNELRNIKWDFVMCMQLLEHVESPLVTLTELVEIMDEGAFLYVELPNQKDLYQYSNVEINEHINFFSEATMLKIAEILQIKVICIKVGNEPIIRALYQKFNGT